MTKKQDITDVEPKAAAQTVDMLDVAQASSTMDAGLTLEAVTHNAPAVQQVGQLTTAQDNSPMSKALAFMQQGATLADMREMLAIQREWEKGEAEKAYNVAFAAFSAEDVVIRKGQTVNDGPLIGKTYASLDDVLRATKPLLSKHGLSASWKLTKDEPDWLEVTCTIKHVLGHAESTSMGGPPDKGGAKNAMHARASTKSYLERYTYKAALGLSERGDDDDGNGGPTGDPAAGIDTKLLQAARNASLEGWSALAKFTKALTPEQRDELLPVSASLKDAAQAADDKNGIAHAPKAKPTQGPKK
jgi:hypothetical protein